MADGSQEFSWVARLGYAARGFVYLLLGWLALGTRAKAAAGSQAVFDLLQKMPLGTVLLLVLFVGLVGYVVFKFLSALFDIQHRGDDAGGLLHRAGELAACVGYSVLAFGAAEFALGMKHAATPGQAHQATHSFLDWTIGRWAIGAVGIGFLIGAAFQAKEAVTAHFMHRISSEAPRGVNPIGRAGFAARAVVFAIIGWSLMRSAWFDSSSQAKGLGEALLSLRSSGLLYTLVAIGLILFGAFSLITAWFRIIPEVHKQDLKPALR